MTAQDHEYASLVVEGKYKVGELVGEGSMSYVYRGVEEPNKVVAIKIMKRVLVTDEEIVTRFIREIRTCMSIAHPNIVKVFAGGKLPSGEPFLVMEFLEGKTLFEILKEKNTLPINRTLGIVAQAADALEMSHTRGYIHRDIKPQNIMVTPKKPFNQDIVKVLDFGVAKTFGSWNNLDKLATAPGNVLGTPLYMSPEQVLGNKLDGRSDIYSLGCVLYQTLCGRPAIPGTNAMETMKNHLSFTPVHINELMPVKAPERLNEIVQKSMAKKPEDRFESMAEFAETLRRYYMPPLVFRIWTAWNDKVQGKKGVSPVLKQMSRQKKL